MGDENETKDLCRPIEARWSEMGKMDLGYMQNLKTDRDDYAIYL